MTFKTDHNLAKDHVHTMASGYVLGRTTAGAGPVEEIAIGSLGGGGSSDHGALTGLADDDHTQYLNTSRHAAIDAADHGSGAAADGLVLTADGAGGAAWEASAGGARDIGFIYATAANYLLP